jgi:hypothetical protein
VDVKLEEIEAQLGNHGVLLRIREPGGGAHIGRLRFGKAKLRWYPGKTSKNYKEVPISEFIAWLESQ